MEEKLKKETLKWLEKAEAKRKIINETQKNKNFIKNIDAYLSDSKHFLNKNDLIRAFEAVIWAWSWLEILEELHVIKQPISTKKA